VAVGGVSSLSLTWTAPNPNGTAITNYQLVVKRASGVTVSTINTGSGAIARTVSGLSNDEDYFVEVKAQNGVGLSATAGVSNTVHVNWVSVELPMHGGWTNVQHSANNPLRLRISRETGGNGGAGGLAYNHILKPVDGASNSILSNLRADDMLREGDDLNVLVPMWFPTEDWPASVTQVTQFFWARGTATNDIAFSLEASHNQIFFKVAGVTKHTLALVPNTRQVLRIVAKISSDPAVGFVELRTGSLSPGTLVMARQTLVTRPANNANLAIECGMKHSAAIATQRRLRHNGITMTLTRNGLARRVRLDAEADTLFQMTSATPGVVGPNTHTYANIEAAGTGDRVQVIMHAGILAWQFRVYSGDRAVSGQRCEIAMASRRSAADQTLPQKAFLNGDKIVLTSKTWYPSAALFPFGTANQWGVEEQFHQLATDTGSPPHEINIGTGASGSRYSYRHNDSGAPIDNGVDNIIADPPIRGQWYEKELTIYVHDDAAIGYVSLKVNGVTKLAKTNCRTNHLIYPGHTDIGAGEVLGPDLPEQLYWQSGLYERPNNSGGFTVTRELIHADAKIVLYRNPSGPSAV
jgi:hypothetical protein